LRNHKQTPKNIKKNKVLYSIAHTRRLSPDGFPSLLTLRWRRVPMKSERGTIDATYSIHRPPSSRQSNIFIPCEQPTIVCVFVLLIILDIYLVWVCFPQISSLYLFYEYIRAL
jgi:hypothetical protein